MAIFSTLRSQRLATVKTETTEQMITFCLRKEWFALPILAVQKVITLGKIYGDPQNTGVSITAYEEKEIVVVDVAKFIFQDFSSSDIDTFSTKTELERDVSTFIPSFLDWEQQHYLVIININENTEELLGLPIKDQPVMRRVTKSNFKALPKAYLNQGNIKCVSKEIIELPEHPPIFLINPQHLAQAHNLEGIKD